MDIQGALTRKFGPLPAWGWLGIGGGALWYYRQHTAAASSSADQAAAAASNPAYVPSFGQSPFPIDGGAGMSGGGGSNGSSGGASGTSTGTTGGDSGGGPPVINVAAPSAPDASGGNGNGSAPTARPRTIKAKPQHTQAAKAKPGTKKTTKPRAPATTHNNTRAKPTVTKAGSALTNRAATKAISKPKPAAPKPKPKPPVRKVTRR